MLIAKRAVSLLALSAWVAIAIPAEGQSGSGGSNLDKRLSAWEKQLVLSPKISARLSWAQKRLNPSGLRSLEKMGRTLAPAIAAGNDFDSLRNQAELEVSRSYPGLAAMDVSEAAFIVMAMATRDMDDDIRLIMAEMKAMTAAKQKLREKIADLNDWISREMSEDHQPKDISNEKVQKPGTTARVARLNAKTPASPVRKMPLETRTSPVIHLEYVKTPVIQPLPPRDSGLTASGLERLRDDLESSLDSMNELSEMTSLRLQMTMDRRSKFIQTLSNMMKKISTTQDTLVQNIK